MKKNESPGLRDSIQKILESHLPEKHQSQELLEDLTKEMNTSLMEAQKTCNLYMEKSPLGIFVTDAAGNYQSVNAAACQLTGYTEEELLGKSIRDFLAPESQEKGLKHHQELLSNGFAQSEIMGIKKNGEKFWCDLSTVKINENEMLGFVLNLNDRKVIEEKLEEYTHKLEVQNRELEKTAEKAEAATRTKSQFLANMSHEIRTPMNGILGFLQLLEETNMDRQQIRYVDYIKTSTDSLLTLINDILDFSKIESGKLELESIPFDLRSAVEDAVMTQTQRAHSKGLEVSLQLHPSLPQQVKGDPTRLRQILTNLISNAVKFTEAGNIVIACCQKEEAEGISHMEISVTDTGIGISEEAMENLFQTFTQADATTTREYGGSGLGLTITRDLAKLMGGSIQVQSTPGKGSTFIINLPLPVDDSPVQQLSSHQTLKGKHIHIVDDTALNREILRSYLEEAGCLVTESSRGIDVIEALMKQARKGDPVHAVVMDQQMPGMSGDDLAAALKAISSTKEIPLCLVTSVGHKGTAAKASEKGFDAYLTKPLRRRELLDTVASLVTMESQSGEAAPLITRHTLREAHEQQKIRVLVAEDHDVNRDLLVQMLRNRGMRCDVVVNGEEALQACRQTTYDLILMDVQMPVMDGLEATRQIRSLPLEKQPTIVAMTAYAMKEDRKRCLEAGMDAYYSKPVDMDQINALFQENIARIQQEKPESTPLVNEEENRSDALKQLITDTELDQETAESFLQEGISETLKSLIALKEELKKNNYKTVKSQLHSLRGSASNLRMKKVAALFEDAEKWAEAEETENLKKTLEDIQAWLKKYQ